MVSFTSTDLNASLPSPSTLTNGTGTFQGTFLTAGTQTITATDSANSLTITSSSITVAVPTLVVNTNIDDSGLYTNCTPQIAAGSNTTDSACSLRDAVQFAEYAGAGNISFDSTAFAASNGTAANTILLSNSTLNIFSNTSITGSTTGSGATLSQIVTVDGESLGPVFYIASGMTSVSISGLSIANGSNTIGGDIENLGALTVANSSITGGSANYGGGIYSGGTLAVTGSTISGNTGNNAGGIGSGGTLTITNSTISGNTTGPSGNSGGGICVSPGTATLTNTTVYNNYAAGDGGGICNYGSLTLNNSTVYGNLAGDTTGGIVSLPGSMTLVSSTIAGNQGIGILIYDTTVSMSNTVISGNGTDVSNQGSTVITDNGGNLTGGVALAPLANYGGPTQTAIPLPGSPAICAGLLANIPAGVTTDQRGFSNINVHYPGYSTTACVDSGAVQTNYALAFSTQPSTSSSEATIASGVAITPAPAVAVMESGMASAGGTVAMTAANGTLSGTTSQTAAGGTALFGGLSIAQVESNDTLTATLRLNPALSTPLALSATSYAFNLVNATPALTTPTPGSKLTSSSATFTWSAGLGVTKYEFRLGTTGPGSTNLYNSAEASTTALTSGLISNIPTTGAPLYARLPLFDQRSLAIQRPHLHGVRHSGSSGIDFSHAGKRLTGASATFTWSAGGGVTEYEFRLGTIGPGSTNVYNSAEATTTALISGEVSNIPTNAAKLYARLYSLIKGAWQYTDYTYTELGPAMPSLSYAGQHADRLQRHLHLVGRW